MTKKKVVPKAEVKEIEVPIKWYIPDSIITRFASNMVVQNIEGHFKLMSFEMKPEIRLEETRKPPKEAIAECVACVMIPPHKMPAVINALVGNSKN